MSYLAATEELAGDYAAAVVALGEADDVTAWYDWPSSPAFSAGTKLNQREAIAVLKEPPGIDAQAS